MSKKTPKNVQPATTPKPEKLNKPKEVDADVKPTPATEEDTEAVLRKEASPTEHEGPQTETPEEQIQLTPEQRIERLEAFFSKLVDRITPMIELSDQIRQRQQQAEQKQQEGGAKPQTGNANLMAGAGQILPLIMQMMGGGGSNPLGDELTKKVIDAGLQQMFAGTELLKAMQTKMLADMGAKAVKESFDSKAKSS